MKIIKKYFSYGMLYSTNEQFEEAERNKTLKEDDVRLNFEDFLRSLGINRNDKKNGYKVKDILDKYIESGDIK